jgi:hypothetical protein
MIRTDPNDGSGAVIDVAVIDVPVESNTFQLILNAFTVGRAAYDYSVSIYGVSREPRITSVMARQPAEFMDGVGPSPTMVDNDFWTFFQQVSDTALHNVRLPVYSGLMDITFRISTGATAPTSVAAMWVSIPTAPNTPIGPRLLVSAASSFAAISQTVKLPNEPCILNYQGIAAAANDTNMDATFSGRGQE